MFGGNQQPQPLPTSSSTIPIDENTLDESIWRTLGRDLMTIVRNLRTVLIPIDWKFSNQEQALRNWDLWGPLIFILMLALTLSWGEGKSQGYKSAVFAMVFAECGLGAIIMTANVILLGGDIVFFQSLCLLGYCLFPICISAIVCAIFSQPWVRCLALFVGLGWASWATIPFVGNAVPPGRKALAVYPVVLMYTSIGWLALVMP